MRFYAAEAGRIGGSQWVLSMDIGQAVDPSAITIVEKIGGRQNRRGRSTHGKYHRITGANPA